MGSEMCIRDSEKTMAYVSGTLKTGDKVIVGGASKVAEGQAVRDSQ